MQNEINVMTWGGVGDLLLCTPALAALKTSDPRRRLVVLARSQDHADILRHNPHVVAIKVRRNRRWFQAMRFVDRKRGKRYVELQIQRIPPTWLSDRSVVHAAAEILNVTVTDPRAQVFFTSDEEAQARQTLAAYPNPVIMHVSSTASVNHLWQPHKWDALVSALPEYTFIQLGNQSDPEVKGVVDFRGKTTLRGALCLIKFAASFVGIDSGFMHATSAFGTPGVVLFGDSSPLNFGHSNNINIYKNVDCAPCFYLCLGARCPYGHECMESISVEEVRDALVRQMRSGTTH